VPEKIAQQRELEVQALGERGVRAIALDAQTQDARAELDETGVVLTEPLQLDRSNAAEVKEVPREHDWAALELLGQRDWLSSGRWQREVWYAVADAETAGGLHAA
jgi:hypothetical protein